MKPYMALLVVFFQFVLNFGMIKDVNCDESFFTHSKRFKTLQRHWEMEKNEVPTSELPSSAVVNTSKDKEFSLLAHFDKELSSCGPEKIDIRELSILQVQEYFKTGKLTSAELTKCYIRRISKMNSVLKAIIEVNPDAIARALKSDSEMSVGINRGPLHGIPILIKDNIGTTDKMETTAGSLALVGVKPLEEAEVVKRLRKAGAVILGKTNLSEFANFRGTNMPSGWSGRGGQTMCPYNSSESTSGSSSGSAVAVAANLAMVALGTETDASIAFPAARQALVGLKPTKGVVPTEGVIPLAFSQDVVGPMTRNVEDAAIVFAVIAGRPLQYDLNNDECSKQFRIGILGKPYWNVEDGGGYTSHEKAQLELLITTLKEIKEFTILDPVHPDLNTFDKVTSDAEFTVFSHEFKWAINEYLDKMVKKGSNISSLADIIQFNNENPNPEGYNQGILIDADLTDGLENLTYINSKELNQQEAKKFLDFVLDSTDAVVTPCDLKSESIVNMAAISGYPSITIPAGFREDGVPFGITFASRANEDEMLLRIAHIFEKTFPVRKAPDFRTSGTATTIRNSLINL